MAFVMLAPSLSWPVWIVCVLATVIAVALIATQPAARRIAGAFMFSLCLAVTSTKLTAATDQPKPEVVISDEICQAYPWILECWCKWCL